MVDKEWDRAAPILWLGFSIGGFIAALVMPAFIFLLAFGPALDLAPDVLAPAVVRGWLANPLVKLFWLVGAIATIFHAFHRFKYILYDYGGSRHKGTTDAFAYGIFGLAVAAILYLVFLL